MTIIMDHLERPHTASPQMVHNGCWPKPLGKILNRLRRPQTCESPDHGAAAASFHLPTYLAPVCGRPWARRGREPGFCSELGLAGGGGEAYVSFAQVKGWIVNPQRTNSMESRSEDKFRQAFELASDALFLISKDTGQILGDGFRDSPGFQGRCEQHRQGPNRFHASPQSSGRPT